MRFLIYILSLAIASAETSKSANQLIAEGRHTEAAFIFAALAEQHTKNNKLSDAAKSHLNAASCLKISGDLGLASEQLDKAKTILEKRPNPTLHLHLLASRGSLTALGKKPHLAIKTLETASDLALSKGQTSLLAEIKNDLGIAYASSASPSKALLHFKHAESLSSPSPFKSQVQQNQLIAAFQQWSALETKLVQLSEFDGYLDNNLLDKHTSASNEFRRYFKRNIRNLNQQKADSSHIFHAITAGISAVRFGLEEAGFQTLKSALHSAQSLKDPTLERSCLLALAELYLEQSLLEDAAKILMAARQISAKPVPIHDASLDLLHAKYQTLANPGSPDTFAALEQAITSIEAIRSDLARTQHISDLGTTFRQKAGQPYLFLADYHLAKPNPGPADFAAARVAIESFKAWELEDFYRDDCVNLSLQNQRNLEKEDQIPPGTGILYMIPLGNRTEILLGTSQGTLRWRSSISSSEISRLARILRYRLESDYGSIAYQEPASELYSQLIAPGEHLLKKNQIKHLVFIPDGALGNIPLQTLLNPRTNRFLLEDFSLSISPSFAMTSGTDEDKAPKQAFLAGCSQFSGDVTSLPGITRELREIQNLYSSPAPLLNHQFTSEALAQSIKENPANIIHIGTHGEFGGTAKDTFLLTTGNEKISLDSLEQMIRPRKYRGTPIDLLCLSACRTAAGDDRAALGFAGTAVKAGCRSVVATLWYVDDTASSEIITAFHQNYHSGLTKAQALRKAQLDYLRSNRHSHPPHPHFWAPFVLIGEWN